MEIQPQAPKNRIFQKNYFFEKFFRFRFHRALNHPQTLSLVQVMQENVILAYYAQIWKFGPRLSKMEFFKKISFFWKGLQISLLTSPQPPADIKFKSSYARKHIIKKVESRTQLLNSEWRSYHLPVLHLRGLWPEYYTRELELSIKVFCRITLASACEGNCYTYYASCICSF